MTAGTGSALRSARFLVAGGAGFIGSALVRALLEQGHRVRVVDNFSTGRRENLDGVMNEIELQEGDLAAHLRLRQRDGRSTVMKAKRWVVMGALAVALAASGTTFAADKAKEAAATDESKNELAPANVNPDYRIGVNDILDVHVWKEPELSRVVPVRPDGRISLPLAGELLAEGHTSLELRGAIAERLREYVGAPEVTVMVREINSQRYFVMGEVQAPGSYPLTVPITVMQALAMAGGFREFADTSNIFILRRAEGNRTVRIEFSYKDWIKQKKTIEHLELLNGDVIIVP